MNIKENKSTYLIKSTNNGSFGTGFVIKSDENGSYLVTCTHVVEDCKEEFLEVEGKQAKLLHLGSSISIDLAVLYVEGLANTKVLNLCIDNIDEKVPFEIEGFKPHKKGSFKFEKLDGSIKKVSEIYIDEKTIKIYELSLEKEDSIEKGYSGSAVVLRGTNTVIAVATDRNKNGKDAYAIPIAYLKNIWKEMPKFVTCHELIGSGGIEKESLENRQAEIEEYIILNDFNEATKMMIDFISKTTKNKMLRREALLYQSMARSLNDEVRKYGKNSDIERQLKKLSSSLFEFLELIVDDYNRR